MADKPTQACFENYPFWIPLISMALLLAIYALGAALFYRLGMVWVALYLSFCLWAEWRVLAKSCAHCYYYGKLCAFGKGVLCARLFRRQNPEAFTHRKTTWLDILPDFFVLLLPILAGIAILFRHFNWMVLAQIVLLILLGFPATGAVRGQLACRHCRQRELGCPAQRLFASAQGKGNH